MQPTARVVLVQVLAHEGSLRGKFTVARPHASTNTNTNARARMRSHASGMQQQRTT
jgi:hypothetical protein